MRLWVVVGLTLGLFAGPMMGCTVSPPPACVAYVQCFYGDDESPYAGNPDYADLVAQRDQVRGTYGEGGECWRLGLADPLAARCEESCLAVLDSACRAFTAGRDDGFCVASAGDAPAFIGGDVTLSCNAIEEALQAFGATEAP